MKEVITRAKFQPQLVGASIKKEDMAFLGTDPGDDVTEAWWEEMLVQWFDVLEEEKADEEKFDDTAESDSPSKIQTKA